MIDFEKIYEKVIDNLENNLPSWLTYHNADHTKYVLNKAEEIAEQENVSGRELLLVKIAALYHDVGFLEDREDHEKRGCRIVSSDFKESALSPEEREKICGMIMATHVPQKPANLLEQIVADADLEYLGTENFNKFGKNLYREILHYEPDFKIREWDEVQSKFLMNHRYHTNYCKVNKEPGKQKNLEILRNRLMAYKK